VNENDGAATFDHWQVTNREIQIRSFYLEYIYIPDVAALAGFEGDHLAYGLDSIETIMSTVDLLTGEFANEYG
jgi:hypothetical protein